METLKRKLKLPDYGVGVHIPLGMIENEINLLWEQLNNALDRIAELESPAPVFYGDYGPGVEPTRCLCDAEYTGTHKWDCKVGRRK